MKGIVKCMSANKIRVAVLTEYGYTVFDVEGGEIEYGNIITGSLDEHGFQVVTNESTGRKASVYIEAVQASPKSAQALCLGIGRR